MKVYIVTETNGSYEFLSNWAFSSIELANKKKKVKEEVDKSTDRNYYINELEIDSD